MNDVAAKCGPALSAGLCGGVSHFVASKLESQVQRSLSGVRLPFAVGERPALGPPRTEAAQLGVVAGSITRWLPSLLVRSENGPASTVGRMGTLPFKLRDPDLRSNVSRKALQTHRELGMWR